ncbi:hypothetical protein CLOHYLEM_06804 [[Clostridium] hylemonae DSM 15053]|uniref:Uncharacterized protein n=1 Tax=[Clostridium] hylemonae DSM 15053 TaxID=553973 RepID=C0C3Z1_9FIRM|nr:hypothetical protein CLOHYLEM_06804 [[Clostridium] hylemonae DSM 15053]
MFVRPKLFQSAASLTGKKPSLWKNCRRPAVSCLIDKNSISHRNGNWNRGMNKKKVDAFFLVCYTIVVTLYVQINGGISGNGGAGEPGNRLSFW